MPPVFNGNDVPTGKAYNGGAPPPKPNPFRLVFATPDMIGILEFIET
jgi:hypothetical protein